MRNILRISLPLLLCAVLLLSLGGAALAAPNYSSWFKSDYMELNALELLPSKFQNLDLTKPISRQEMCELAVPALEKVTGNAIEPSRSDYFPDTRSSSIVKAHELGIVNGYEDGTFRPEQNLTRQEFFVIVRNFCKAAAFQPNANGADLSAFPDNGQVDQWALEAAQICVKYSYVNGSLENGVTLLKPKASLSRQEAMTMFLRCYKGLSEYYYYVANAKVVALSGGSGTVTTVDGVTVTDAEGSMQVNTSRLNVRSRPSVSGSVLGTLPLGYTVTVTGVCSNQWLRIRYNGQTGYVSGAYLTYGPTSSGIASDIAVTIANEAMKFIGYPYIWGAESPKEGFDCSGLVYYVFGMYGFRMNRVADDQMNQGTQVAYGDLLAGDLVFFGYGDYADHVGIYIGNGNFVHAANPTSGVKISSMSETYYAKKYLCAKRITG